MTLSLSLLVRTVIRGIMFFNRYVNSTLFIPKCINRIHIGGFTGWDYAENNAYEHGKEQGDHRDARINDQGYVHPA